MNEWKIDDLRQAAAQAIGVDTWDIPDDADLLERGLDSLRMMRLSGALRVAGYDIPVTVLAEKPTINAWFAVIEGARP